MREELKKRAGRRGEFHATFKRKGVRNSAYGLKVTALFVNVCDAADTLVTDHLWFSLGKQMQRLQLKSGDRVRFVATVASYVKRDREADAYDNEVAHGVTDYRLIYPSNMRKLGEAPARMPLFDQPEAS